MTLAVDSNFIRRAVEACLRPWLAPGTAYRQVFASLERRAAFESREQSLFGGYFDGHLGLLPKRFNVEQRFWDSAADLTRWRATELAARGAAAVPTLAQAAVRPSWGALSTSSGRT